MSAWAGFWIGLGLAAAGLFIGDGIGRAGTRMAAGLVSAVERWKALRGWRDQG